MESLKSYITAIVAVAMIIGFSSYKLHQKFDPPSDGWYEVSITNPMSPDVEANQSISPSLGTEPQEEDDQGCAQQDNTGNRCYIHLSFSPGATSVPSTVEAARLDSLNVTVGPDAKLPE